MAGENGRSRSRKRTVELAAAKERRQKLILIVGGIALLALLALEGPGTISKLRGHKAAPAVAAPAAPTSGGQGAPTRAGGEVKAHIPRGFVAKDPFVSQVPQPAVTATPTIYATPPTVRLKQFVAKDPFVAQVIAVAPVAQHSGTSRPVAPPPQSTSPKGYIVILQSIPLRRGSTAAARAVVAARNAGLRKVGVADSSAFRTLRPGFFTVYMGTYPTLSQALRQLGRAVGQGYDQARTLSLGA